MELFLKTCLKRCVVSTKGSNVFELSSTFSFFYDRCIILNKIFPFLILKEQKNTCFQNSKLKYLGNSVRCFLHVLCVSLSIYSFPLQNVSEVMIVNAVNV